MKTHQLEIFNEIIGERERQDRKWGEQNHDPITYLAILTEEVGELSQAALHYKFGGPEADRVRDEALHVAAVALAYIECLDRNKYPAAHGYGQKRHPVSMPIILNP